MRKQKAQNKNKKKQKFHPPKKKQPPQPNKPSVLTKNCKSVENSLKQDVQSKRP